MDPDKMTASQVWEVADGYKRERDAALLKLSQVETDLAAVRILRNEDLGRLDQITAMVRASTMAPMARLAAVERICGVEKAYRPTTSRSTFTATAGVRCVGPLE
jgi:hypothetical protein